MSRPCDGLKGGDEGVGVGREEGEEGMYVPRFFGGQIFKGVGEVQICVGCFVVLPYRVKGLWGNAAGQMGVKFDFRKRFGEGYINAVCHNVQKRRLAQIGTSKFISLLVAKESTHLRAFGVESNFPSIAFAGF